MCFKTCCNTKYKQFVECNRLLCVCVCVCIHPADTQGYSLVSCVHSQCRLRITYLLNCCGVHELRLPQLQYNVAKISVGPFTYAILPLLYAKLQCHDTCAYLPHSHSLQAGRVVCVCLHSEIEIWQRRFVVRKRRLFLALGAGTWPPRSIARSHRQPFGTLMRKP